MSRILIVAQREFLRIGKTRSFWIILLLVPVMVMIIPPLSERLMRTPKTSHYVLVDASGRYEQGLVERQALADQYDVLCDFARYAVTWRLRPRAAEAVRGRGERRFTDDEVRAFVAAGGVQGALQQAAPLPPNVPPFRPDPPAVVRLNVPDGVPVDEGADAFGAAIARYMVGSPNRPPSHKGVASAIYIPADYGAAGVQARIWTANGPNRLVDRVRKELDFRLRNDMATAAGVDPATAERLQTASAPLAILSPPQPQGSDWIVLQSALPLVMTYFLMICVFISAAWLLQGLLEERSNKLMEAILACVSPSELMYGKLIGIAGIGFSVMVVWGASFVAGGNSLPSPAKEMIVSAMSSLNTPWLVAALLFYFVTGYLVSATLYLAVGAVSESTLDAQAYMLPVSMVLWLPLFLLGSLIGNADAVPPKVLSWIPLYTPYAMMARMGVGVETWEVIGTAVLLVAFIAVELWLLGKLFRHNLLRAGQQSKLGGFLRGLFKRTSR